MTITAYPDEWDPDIGEWFPLETPTTETEEEEDED